MIMGAVMIYGLRPTAYGLPASFWPGFGQVSAFRPFRPVAEGRSFFRPLAERLAEMIFFPATSPGLGETV